MGDIDDDTIDYNDAIDEMTNQNDALPAVLANIVKNDKMDKQAEDIPNLSHRMNSVSVSERGQSAPIPSENNLSENTYNQSLEHAHSQPSGNDQDFWNGL